MAKVRQRKRDIVESFRSDSQSRIEKTQGLDLLMGEASFSGPKTLDVRLDNGEVRWLTANTIFINAGARPAKPALSDIEAVPTLDSTSIMELDTLPEHQKPSIVPARSSCSDGFLLWFINFSFLPIQAEIGPCVHARG